MDHTKLLSIIIPTYNRKAILRQTLESIQKQQEMDLGSLEVIVVDDGSSDGTEHMMRELEKEFSYAIIYLRQSNQGQGQARNLALKHATGYLVLFIGDDIILDPHFLYEHEKVHRKYHQENIACLGFTTWHPKLKVTPFMYFLEHGGPQFNYPKLEKSKTVDWELELKEASFWYFYTSNISLKRSFLANEQFESVYTGYGWEDIDFGYTLTKKKQLRILYNAKAKGQHWHEIDQSSFQKRMTSIGQNAVVFSKRYPEVKVLPTGLKKICFQLISSGVSIALLKFFSRFSKTAEQWYFYALSKKYFLEGLYQ